MNCDGYDSGYYGLDDYHGYGYDGYGGVDHGYGGYGGIDHGHNGYGYDCDEYGYPLHGYGYGGYGSPR